MKGGRKEGRGERRKEGRKERRKEGRKEGRKAGRKEGRRERRKEGKKRVAELVCSTEGLTVEAVKREGGGDGTRTRVWRNSTRQSG